MPASSRKLRSWEAVFNGDHHVCAFFHNKDEEFRTLAPWTLEGLAAGEKSIHIVGAKLQELFKQRLTEAGVDVAAAERSGQLEVTSWPADPHRGILDQDGAIEMIDGLLSTARKAGYPWTRIIGEMDWTFDDQIPENDFLSLETRLTEVYARHDVWVICAYDLSHFHSSVVLDVMRTHPAALVGGILQRNPFHVPPAQMLEELRGRSGLVAS
jgi:hypothetical protein